MIDPAVARELYRVYTFVSKDLPTHTFEDFIREFLKSFLRLHLSSSSYTEEKYSFFNFVKLYHEKYGLSQGFSTYHLYYFVILKLVKPYPDRFPALRLPQTERTDTLYLADPKRSSITSNLYEELPCGKYFEIRDANPSIVMSANAVVRLAHSPRLLMPNSTTLPRRYKPLPSICAHKLSKESESFNFTFQTFWLQNLAIVVFIVYVVVKIFEALRPFTALFLLGKKAERLNIKSIVEESVKEHVEELKAVKRPVYIVRLPPQDSSTAQAGDSAPRSTIHKYRSIKT